MLLTLPNSAAPSERAEKDLVDVRVERGKLEPLLQVAERFVVGNALDEVLQQGGVAGAESPPLGGEPAVEDQAAVEFQPLEKVSIEEHGQRPQPIRREPLDAPLDHTGDLDGIDEAIRQVEFDGILPRPDASAGGFVDEAADLAEAPAELSLRIVGDIPQEFAKLRSGRCERRQGQIGEECAHLTRCGQWQRATVTANGQRPQHAHTDRRPATSPDRAVEFHGDLHGGYHLRLRGPRLRSRSAERVRDATDYTAASDVPKRPMLGSVAACRAPPTAGARLAGDEEFHGRFHGGSHGGGARSPQSCM